MLGSNIWDNLIMYRLIAMLQSRKLAIKLIIFGAL